MVYDIVDCDGFTIMDFDVAQGFKDSGMFHSEHVGALSPNDTLRRNQDRWFFVIDFPLHQAVEFAGLLDSRVSRGVCGYWRAEPASFHTADRYYQRLDRDFFRHVNPGT